MQPRRLLMDREAADQLITYAFVGLVIISLLSATAYLALGGDKNAEEMASPEWVDPVVEIEDENHSHTDLLAHRLQTCLLYTSPSPRDRSLSRMPSSA